WFVQAEGGAGLARAVGPELAPEPPPVSYGGAIGYKAYAYTVGFVYDHSFRASAVTAGGDIFRSATATWSWHRPGRNWSAQGELGRWQQISIGYPVINSWLVSAGVNRRLNSQMTLRAQYGIGELGSKRFVQSGVAYRISHSSARLALIWTPQLRLGR